jgi:hypothetical protein
MFMKSDVGICAESYLLVAGSDPGGETAWFISASSLIS